MQIRDGRVVKLDHPFTRRPTSVYRDKHGIIWMGTLGLGILKLANDGIHPIDTPGKTIGAITQDDAGRLWAVNAGLGLFRLENGKWTNLASLGGPRSGSISALTDAAGRVWFGFQGDRVVRLDREDLTIFSKKDGIRVGDVTALAGRDADVLIGGDHGLAVFNGKGFAPVLPIGEESFSGIRGIVATEGSGLWFGEARGIVHIAADDIRRIKTDSSHRVAYELFDVQDGLATEVQITSSNPTSIEGADGRIWFGTGNSIVWIDPKRITRNNIAPGVSVKSMYANGRTYSPRSEVILPARTTNARIAFTALSLSIPQRVRFRYRLDGVDKDWQESGTSPSGVNIIPLDSSAARSELIGSNRGLRKVWDSLHLVARTDSTVLIQGETGTGKELVAKAIHEESLRQCGPYVKLNCGAVPGGLLESELFGHERGAFTGALTQTTGRFQYAHKGTLFLDEIGDLPAELQPKLLRVLQEKEFERLGANRTIRVDVRVVAATNQDLHQLVRERRFRADLFYRLNVFPITLPPLRERREDIPLLAQHFVRKYASGMKKEVGQISEEAMELLRQHDWPGNVRELQNFVERAVIMSSGPNLEMLFGELKPMAEGDTANGDTVQGDRPTRIRTLAEAQRRDSSRALWRRRPARFGPNDAAISDARAWYCPGESRSSWTHSEFPSFQRI